MYRFFCLLIAVLLSVVPLFACAELAGTTSDDFVIPKETLEIARELCKKLSETCNKLEYKKEHYKEELQKELNVQKDEIFNDGVKYGRNLLFQLNKGEITLDDFNKDIKKYTR